MYICMYQCFLPKVWNVCIATAFCSSFFFIFQKKPKKTTTAEGELPSFQTLYPQDSKQYTFFGVGD